MSVSIVTYQYSAYEIIYPFLHKNYFSLNKVAQLLLTPNISEFKMDLLSFWAKNLQVKQEHRPILTTANLTLQVGKSKYAEKIQSLQFLRCDEKVSIY